MCIVFILQLLQLLLMFWSMSQVHMLTLPVSFSAVTDKYLCRIVFSRVLDAHFILVKLYYNSNVQYVIIKIGIFSTKVLHRKC